LRSQDTKCDICDRSVSEIREQGEGDGTGPQLNAGGIWICSECMLDFSTRRAVFEDDLQLEHNLDSLVGKNAGAIAMTLNLPYVKPIKVVIDGAIAVQESLRSPWTFVTLDSDGNTLWLSPDRKSVVRVDPEGNLEVQTI